MDNNSLNNQEKEKILEKINIFEKSPWTFLIRKGKLTILIVVSLLIFGLITIESLPRELNPEVEVPIAIVSTVYPGASPLDVEEQVTSEIENSISEISGIKRVESTSSLGFSSIVVEFEAGENIDEAIDELKDKVEQTSSELPDDVSQDPRVIEINFDDQSILTATLTSNLYDISDLKVFGENIEDRIKGIQFVSDVVAVGGLDRVVKVNVNQELLSDKGLSFGGVLGKLKSANVNFPVGSIEVDDSRYNIRVQGEFQSAQEVSSLPIGTDPDGRQILLEDVADVADDFAKEQTKSRLSIDGGEPTEAVSIQVFKKSGGDVTKIAEEVRKKIEAARGEAYPENVTVEITNDFSVFISDSINTLIRNGLTTVLIILFLMFLFLGWKEAILAGPAVPFSFFIAFIVMAMLGESINFLSLFALVLSLGLLVDSAVVVVEGMYHKVQSYKLSGYQAAISTVEEYAGPLLSGMLTTVAAFLPLLFVIGIFGEFIKVIPTVVITTLFAGLFVSLSIIPAFGSYLIKPVTKTMAGCGEKCQCQGRIARIKCLLKSRSRSKPRQERFFNKLFERFIEQYRKHIPKILMSKKWRRLLLGGSWALFLISLALPISGLLRIQAFGEQDSEFFFINLEMPPGTVLERTDQVVQKIERELLDEPQVVNFVTNIGASVSAEGASSTEGDSNKAFIQVNLSDDLVREIESPQIVSTLRSRLELLVTEGDVTFVQQESGPPTGKPIVARITGPDLLVLDELAEKIKAELEQIPTTIDVETSTVASSGELVFIPNKDIIDQSGLSVSQIASELRTGIARDNTIEITREGEELEIDLGIPDASLGNFEDIKNITIANQTGQEFAIDELGQIKFEPALAAINRLDNERVVTISANTEGGNPSQITQQLQERMQNLDLPSGYVLSFGGEAQELREVYMDMLIKMLLGIVLILFILVLQFNSYKQTLIILFTIPLAMIGVFSGMTIFRLQLDIPAFIGIVSLAGIVVNNAIILIDQINRELADGKGLIEATNNAACVRMRPIFLTTITTVAGLLPLSITQPIWRNLGFAIIFGLTFSTALTLIVIPTLFVSFYRKKFQIT